MELWPVQRHHCVLPHICGIISPLNFKYVINPKHYLSIVYQREITEHQLSQVLTLSQSHQYDELNFSEFTEACKHCAEVTMILAEYRSLIGPLIDSVPDIITQPDLLPRLFLECTGITLSTLHKVPAKELIC